MFDNIKHTEMIETEHNEHDNVQNYKIYLQNIYYHSMGAILNASDFELPLNYLVQELCMIFMNEFKLAH